jgi:hypothetical protein
MSNEIRILSSKIFRLSDWIKKENTFLRESEELKKEDWGEKGQFIYDLLREEVHTSYWKYRCINLENLRLKESLLNLQQQERYKKEFGKTLEAINDINWSYFEGKISEEEIKLLEDNIKELNLAVSDIKETHNTVLGISSEEDYKKDEIFIKRLIKEIDQLKDEIEDINKRRRMNFPKPENYNDIK